MLCAVTPRAVAPPAAPPADVPIAVPPGPVAVPVAPRPAVAPVAPGLPVVPPAVPAPPPAAPPVAELPGMPPVDSVCVLPLPVRFAMSSPQPMPTARANGTPGRPSRARAISRCSLLIGLAVIWRLQRGGQRRGFLDESV